jgi:hypothetical protein
MGEATAIRQVVDRVQCEVWETVEELNQIPDKKLDWIHYVAKATLTLQINSDGGVAPEVSLLGPFNSGTFSLGFGGGLTGGANRIATYGFNIVFAKAEQSWCRDRANNGYPPLQGSIGLREWLTIVFRSHEVDDPFPRPKSMSHRTEFTLDGNLKISPAYTLARSKGSSVFSLHRKDFHTLDVAVEYVDPLAPDYNKVCVVNLAGPCHIGGAAVVRRTLVPAAKSLAGRVEPSRRAITRRGVLRAPRRPTPEITPQVQDRLDRALQNLELRSIGPRF